MCGLLRKEMPGRLGVYVCARDVQVVSGCSDLSGLQLALAEAIASIRYKAAIGHMISRLY